jgi:hypothetical protein
MFIATPVAWIVLASGTCSEGSFNPATETVSLVSPSRIAFT